MIPTIVHTFASMRNSLLIIVQLLVVSVAFSQEDTVAVPMKAKPVVTEDRAFDDRGILLTQEFTGGLILHSQGWGINLRRSKNKTYKRKRVVELDIVSMNHPKKVLSPGADNSYRSYVYGRTYQLLMSRVGYGRQNTLYERFDKGLEIRYLYIGGFSAAWAKPVYLQIGDSGQQFPTINSERYDPNEHSREEIYGSSSFLIGLNGIRVYPGLYGKAGVSFDYAKRDRGISTIECGVIVDGYFQVVEQMANTRNYQVFATLYVSLNFGTKWYKR